MYYEKSCNVDNANGCLFLADFRSDNTSSLFDVSSAAIALEKACGLKERNACFSLGMYYDKGIGVEKNKGRAVEMYRAACDVQSEGKPDQCSEIGLNCLQGYSGMCQYRNELIDQKRRSEESPNDQ